jgi:hypothetical protein
LPGLQPEAESERSAVHGERETTMSVTLYRTNEPYAEEIAELVKIGMLDPIEIDVENPAAYLHATIWSYLKDHWGAITGPHPSKDEVLHWIKTIIELGVGGDE